VIFLRLCRNILEHCLKIEQEFSFRSLAIHNSVILALPIAYAVEKASLSKLRKTEEGDYHHNEGYL
jgi:hypothetical protein